jgi:hypothetical protein
MQDRKKLYAIIHSIMKSIEGGRLTDVYATRVAPYRKVIQQLHPEDLSMLLNHDFRHFSMDLRSAVRGSVWDKIQTGKFEDVRLRIPQIIKEGIMPTDMASTPPTNPRARGFHGTQGEQFERGEKIKPFFADYALTLLDSISYLEALASSNTKGEEQFLRSLEERRLPLAPICDLYGSQFRIEGSLPENNDFTIDGLRFLAIYNLLTNARQHCILSTNDDGKKIASITEVDNVSGTITVSNLSDEPLPEDFASMNAIGDTGYYGSFIADLYASLAGSRLSHHSEIVGEHLRTEGSHYVEGSGVQLDQIAVPKYQISVLLH